VKWKKKKTVRSERCWDCLLSDAIISNQVYQKRDLGDISVLITHIQVDEIADLADKNRDKMIRLLLTILKIRPVLVPTEGGVVGVSRIDHSTIASSDAEKVIQSIRTNKRAKNPSRDALIVSTALSKADIYVSNDVDQISNLRSHLKRQKNVLEALNWREFQTWLQHSSDWRPA